MNRITKKVFAAALTVIMAAMILSGCNAKEAAEKDAAPAAEKPYSVTIEADGKKITIENATDVTISDLLEKAQISLNEGDVIILDTDSNVSEGLSFKVLHRCTVTVTVEGESAEQSEIYTVVLTGGTVEEALRAAGIELTENQELNFDPVSPLEDGMEIAVTEKSEEEKDPPESTEEKTEEDNQNTENAPVSNLGNSKPTSKPEQQNSKPGQQQNSKPGQQQNNKPEQHSDPKPQQEQHSDPEPQPEQKPDPEPQQGGRTVVRVDTYEDCDGSGHGVKVYTYSDGTQEEVEY